jgi:hypothetical protein
MNGARSCETIFLRINAVHSHSYFTKKIFVPFAQILEAFAVKSQMLSLETERARAREREAYVSLKETTRSL